ncbi:hypothetical protein C0993_008750, partial [Termitomyces sp. T159_Od127]
DLRQPPALVLHPPRHLSYPPALPALLHAPPPAPLRSPMPHTPLGAPCLYAVNSRKVDSPSRLSPRGQRNLTGVMVSTMVEIVTL